MAVSLYQPPDPLTIEQFLSPCSIIQVTLCPLALRSFTKMENMGSPYEVVDSLGLFDGGHYRIDYSEFRISKPKSVVYGCFLTGSQPGWIRCIAYGSTQEAALNACCAQLIAICSQKPVLATNLLSSYQTSQNGKFQLFSQPCLVAAPDTSLSLTTPLNESELANQDESVLEQSRISESQEEPQLKEVKVEPGIIDPNYMCSTPIDKNHMFNSESPAETKKSDDHVKDFTLCSDNHGVEKESTSEFNNDGCNQSMEAHKNGESKIEPNHKTLSAISIDQFFDMDPTFSPKCADLTARGRRCIETSLEKGFFMTPARAMSKVTNHVDYLRFTHVDMQFETKEGRIMYLFGLTAFTRARNCRTIAFANCLPLAKSACYAKMLYLFFDERHLACELLRSHWTHMNRLGKMVLLALPGEVVVDTSLAGKFSQTLCAHGVETECKMELKTNLYRADHFLDDEPKISVTDARSSSKNERVSRLTTYEVLHDWQVISFEEFLDIEPTFRETCQMPLSEECRAYMCFAIRKGKRLIGKKRRKLIFPSLSSTKYRILTSNDRNVFANCSTALNCLTMAFSNHSLTALRASVAKLLYVIYGERQLAIAFYENHWREAQKSSACLYDRPSASIITSQSRTVLQAIEEKYNLIVGCLSMCSNVNQRSSSSPLNPQNNLSENVLSNKKNNLDSGDHPSGHKLATVQSAGNDTIDRPEFIIVDDSEDEHSKLNRVFSSQTSEIKTLNSSNQSLSIDAGKSGKRKLASYSNADLPPCSKRLKNLMTGNETLKYELELIKENVKQTKLSLNNDGQRRAGTTMRTIEKLLRVIQESICCNNLDLSVEQNLVSKEFVVTITVNGLFKFSNSFESFDMFSIHFCKTLKRAKRFVKLLEDATEAPLIPEEMSENVPFLAIVLQKSAGVDVDLLPVTYKYNSKHGKWRAFLETQDHTLKSELKLTKQESAKKLLLPYMTDILGFQVV